MGEPASRTKTSVDILEERNELRTRVDQLESAMALVRRETDYGLRNPEICVLALSRIDSVARGVIDESPASAVRAKTVAHGR